MTRHDGWNNAGHTFDAMDEREGNALPVCDDAPDDWAAPASTWPDGPTPEERFATFGPEVPPEIVERLVREGAEVWSFQYGDDPDSFTTLDLDDLRTVYLYMSTDVDPGRTVASLLASWWGPFRTASHDDDWTPAELEELAGDATCPDCGRPVDYPHTADCIRADDDYDDDRVTDADRASEARRGGGVMRSTAYQLARFEHADPRVQCYTPELWRSSLPASTAYLAEGIAQRGRWYATAAEGAELYRHGTDASLRPAD